MPYTIRFDIIKIPFSLQQINHQIHYQNPLLDPLSDERKLKLSLIRFVILFFYCIFTLSQKCLWMILIICYNNRI